MPWYFSTSGSAAVQRFGEIIVCVVLQGLPTIEATFDFCIPYLFLYFIPFYFTRHYPILTIPANCTK